MKKLTGILLALGILASCSTPREEILKVYNWADYIDEDLITEFEQWYEEQTGEKVTIIYQTFDVNETMLSKIELTLPQYYEARGWVNAFPTDETLKRLGLDECIGK